MSLTMTQAQGAVDNIDQLYRPRPDEATNKDRKRLLALELMTAFAGLNVNQMDVMSFCIGWRRAYDDSEDEQIRVKTRPTGWDLRRVYDQAQQADDAKKPSLDCGTCHDRGRRTIIAVTQARGLLRTEPLVVACECGQGDNVKVGEFYALRKLAVWNRDVREGTARFQGMFVVLVVDAAPVFGPMVLDFLVGLTPGEIIEQAVVEQIDRRVQALLSEV